MTLQGVELSQMFGYSSGWAGCCHYLLADCSGLVFIQAYIYKLLLDEATLKHGKYGGEASRPKGQAANLGFELLHSYWAAS